MNYHSVLILKSMLFSKLLSFNFSLKEPLTLLTMLVETIYYKKKNFIWKYYNWCSQKNVQKYQKFQLPAVFNFHVWQYWISLGLRRPKKVLSTTNKFPSNGFPVRLSVKNKLQEKALEKWDMLIHHVPT